jgi:glutamine synthetase
VDALPHLISRRCRAFQEAQIFTETEIYSRYEIQLEAYSKIINIEALTMVDMVMKDIAPAVTSYIRSLSETALAKKSIDADIPATWRSSWSRSCPP